jgi:hypothetical protein
VVATTLLAAFGFRKDLRKGDAGSPESLRSSRSGLESTSWRNPRLSQTNIFPLRAPQVMKWAGKCACRLTRGARGLSGRNWIRCSIFSFCLAIRGKIVRGEEGPPSQSEWDFSRETSRTNGETHVCARPNRGVPAGENGFIRIRRPKKLNSSNHCVRIFYPGTRAWARAISR